ncbi:hypothetical protein ACWCYY_34985 [Kitasatospora sp. NPDC001664]
MTITDTPRPAAPSGSLTTASWRSTWCTAADLLHHLADMPDSVPVLLCGDLVGDIDTDGGEVRLYSHLTARTAPYVGSPAVPPLLPRSARTHLVTTARLREHLAGVPEHAPVTADGRELTGTSYSGGALHLHTPDD